MDQHYSGWLNVWEIVLRIIEQSVQLEYICPDAMKYIEAAGRTCYKSEMGDTDKFIAGIIRNKHHSVIEHQSASFRVVCNRGILGEITRHRIGMSYSVESSRYCSYDKDKFGNEIKVIRPFNMSDYQESCWKEACEIAEKNYFLMLQAGAKPDVARDVLPMSLATELVLTGTFTALRHFLHLRCSSAAHIQIRDIANKMLAILNYHYPIIFPMDTENYE